MATLASGQSVTLYLGPSQILNITTNGATEGHVTVSPAVGTGAVLNTQGRARFGPIACANSQYGPYGQPVTLVLDSRVGAVTYSISGEGFVKDSAGKTSGMVSPDGGTVLSLGITEQRKQRIDAWASGPVIVAPARANTTAYLAVNGATPPSTVSLPNGIHLVASASGTSGAGAPTGYYAGRPITDGTVTWYEDEFIKTTSDIDAPTVTSANAAAIASASLTETNLTQASDATAYKVTFNDGALFSVSGTAYLSTWSQALGGPTASGNATSDVAAGAAFTVVPTGSSAYQYGGDFYGEFEFYVTDTKFALTCHNFGLMALITIDGKRLEGNFTTWATGGGGGVIIDFNGVMKRRRVTVSRGNFRGVALTAQGKVEAVEASTDTCLLLADSYGNTVVPSTSPAQMALGYGLKKYLGFQGLINAAIGGAGYLQTGASNAYSLTQSIANPDNIKLWQAANPGHVIIHLGSNDLTSFTVAQIRTSARLFWQNVRLLFPTAKISITTSFSSSTGPGANQIALAAGLTAEFVAWADSNSRLITTVGTGAQDSLVWGTGNAGNALTTGNSSMLTSTDGIHPSPTGALFLARNIAAKIITQWKNNY